MNPKQKKLLTRIIVALVLFVAIEVAAQTGVLAAAFGTPGDVYAEFALFLIPYLIAGYDVIAGALRGLVHGHALDEDFLMTVATFGAFAQIIPGIDGLIHISQIADRRIEKPQDELKIGQEVKVKITNVDYDSKRISLSIRALLEDGAAVETAAEEAVSEEAPAEAAAEESAE